MKFFFLFFLVMTALCGYFRATDGPDSGMWIPTLICAVIAIGVGIYNTVVNGGPLREGKSLNDKSGR